MKCAKCGSTANIEEIPDILPGLEVPLCGDCFDGIMDGKLPCNGMKDLPFYPHED